LVLSKQKTIAAGKGSDSKEGGSKNSSSHRRNPSVKYLKPG